MATRIQLRRGLSTGWAASNPTLALGEIGIETDSKNLKMGDGVTAWNSLAYLATGNMTVASGTLDNVNDGTAYKRIAAAVATALNAEGLPNIIAVTDGNSISQPNCFFSTTNTPTNMPSVAYYQGIQWCVDENMAFKRQLVDSLAGKIYYRAMTEANTWSAWFEIFHAGSDGNGGQPPAPKPKAYSSGTTIGEISMLTGTDGNPLVAPAGGKWMCIIWLIVSATGLMLGDYASAAIITGGANITTPGAGYKGMAFVWRIE